MFEISDINYNILHDVNIDTNDFVVIVVVVVVDDDDPCLSVFILFFLLRLLFNQKYIFN
jgi:hypothetical protein